MGKTDEAPQVVDVKQSPAARRASLNTTITLRDAVEMLNSALWYYRKAGGTMRIGNSTSQDNTGLVALEGVPYCKTCHRLKLFEDMQGEECGVCAEKEKT